MSIRRKAFLPLITVAVMLLSWDSTGGAAPDETGRQPFTAPPIRVPEGFTVELAAAPPLVAHPMMGCFDDRGRLYVAASAGENLRREDLEKQLPNFVKRLEDTDGDGRFDKSTIFADKMTLPQGALWHDGALYVAAPPNIWRLRDTDDDGVADERQVLVDKFGYTGNAASVHGCFLGPTGRIFWCDGRHGHEFHDEQGRLVSSGKAARIFSCNPDGSDVRVHCGGGMDNPVEIDFSPSGEMLGTVNIFYRKRGDCLVHWQHGGVYPRFDQQQCISEFRQTGDLLREVHNLGHVAVSGMCRYRNAAAVPQWSNSWFVTEFNTHKLMRLELERQGSSFQATAHEFLQADSDDFHPTDVLEDADGSLLVIDTGGWFRIGCPTSQIAKPSVLGAIYRVRRTGAAPQADPRGLKTVFHKTADTASMIQRLDDPRPAVQRRAIAELARFGAPAAKPLIDALKNESSAETDRNIVWSLARISTPEAMAGIRQALTHREISVRQAAAHALGWAGDKRAVPALSQMVVADALPARREAATALGKIGDLSAVPALIKSLQQEKDRPLEHALVYALIELDQADATRQALASDNPDVRRAALVALDQMPHGELSRQDVALLLDTDDARLQSAVLDVISRHDGWSTDLVRLAEDLLGKESVPDARRSAVVGALVAFAANADVQSLVAERLQSEQTALENRRLLLQVVGRSGLRKLPENWVAALRQCLADEQPKLWGEAVRAVSATDVQPFVEVLQDRAAEDKLPLELRIEMWAALARAGQSLGDPAVDLLRAQIDSDQPPMVRLAAARALGTAPLTEKQRHRVIVRMGLAGPLELAPLMGAIREPLEDKEARNLLWQIGRSDGMSSLSIDQLRQVLKFVPQSQSERSNELLAKLQARDAGQVERLEALAAKISGGDAARGREVFFAQRIGCYACHRVKDEGGRVGPDLTGIGTRRSERDLLEAVVFPSASLARGFETYTVITDGGKVHTGLIHRETSDTIFLRTAAQTELRIQRNEVEQLRPHPTSIMPAGLDRTMTVEQLRDLVAYLRTLK